MSPSQFGLLLAVLRSIDKHLGEIAKAQKGQEPSARVVADRDLDLEYPDW